MASHGDPTQPRGSTSAPATSAPRPPEPGIELSTLLISALASAAAAYVTSKIWAPGTLFSAAMSPVIVALVKEGLRKPTEVVTAAVPSVARPRRSGRPSRSLPDDLPQRLDGGAPPPFPPPQPGAAAATGPVRVYSTRGRRLRWRLAVVTGLLGFGLCVVFFTVPELIAGKSVGRSGHATTFFPGKTDRHHRSTTTTTETGTTTTGTTTGTTTEPKTTTRPTATVTQTVTTPAAPPADRSTTTPPEPSSTAPPAAQGAPQPSTATP